MDDPTAIRWYLRELYSYHLSESMRTTYESDVRAILERNPDKELERRFRQYQWLMCRTKEVPEFPNSYGPAGELD